MRMMKQRRQQLAARLKRQRNAARHLKTSSASSTSSEDETTTTTTTTMIGPSIKNDNEEHAAETKNATASKANQEKNGLPPRAAKPESLNPKNQTSCNLPPGAIKETDGGSTVASTDDDDDDDDDKSVGSHATRSSTLTIPRDNRAVVDAAPPPKPSKDDDYLLKGSSLVLTLTRDEHAAIQKQVKALEDQTRELNSLHRQLTAILGASGVLPTGPSLMGESDNSNTSRMRLQLALQNAVIRNRPKGWRADDLMGSRRSDAGYTDSSVESRQRVAEQRRYFVADVAQLVHMQVELGLLLNSDDCKTTDDGGDKVATTSAVFGLNDANLAHAWNVTPLTLSILKQRLLNAASGGSDGAELPTN